LRVEAAFELGSCLVMALELLPLEEPDLEFANHGGGKDDIVVEVC